MFGRRRSSGGEDFPASPPVATPTTIAGPLDEADAARLDLPEHRGSPERDSLTTVDVGALRVALPDGVTARVVAGAPGPLPGPVQELVLQTGELTVRMAAFAAPRTHDQEVGIRADLAAAPGTPTALAAPAPPGAPPVRAGRYGPEFRSSDSRIIGIDGPRWHLRVIVTPAGDDDSVPAALVDEILRGTVIVRGAAAMPAGAPLPFGQTASAHPTVVTLSDLWTEDPTTTGTGTLESRRDVYEAVSAFTGSLSRNLNTWG